jgi:hypothetical protein
MLNKPLQLKVWLRKVSPTSECSNGYRLLKLSLDLYTQSFIALATNAGNRQVYRLGFKTIWHLYCGYM